MTSFTILNILDVSTSLQSQLSSAPSESGIKKALLSGGHVVYFVDALSLGKGSVIELDWTTQRSPLIRNGEFKILKRTEYSHNKDFIGALINK